LGFLTAVAGSANPKMFRGHLNQADPVRFGKISECQFVARHRFLPFRNAGFLPNKRITQTG
jgi:hypothetical protein